MAILHTNPDRHNFIDRWKKKPITGLLCMMELDDDIVNIEKLITKDKKYIADHMKLTNTFSSISELKLYYHDKPERGKFTETQRWRLMGVGFVGTLLFVQIFQLISQIASGACCATVWTTVGSIAVIATCTALLILNTIRDWGD